MPIDASRFTQPVLNNTVKREIYSEVKAVSPPRMGKVRTIYNIGSGKLLMISSDNLSTHDVVHARQVYAKGENLDAISAYYFENTKHIIPNHFIQPAALNTWLVQEANRIDIEMVFRKYITGSAWRYYVAHDGPEEGTEFCGVWLRPGYHKNEVLDEIIFTPTAKGQAKDFSIPEFSDLDPEEDDPKLTVDVIKKNYEVFNLEQPDDLDFLTKKAFELYDYIFDDLERKGYLLADTKWEFGYFPDTRIGLIDECVTPDSSRMWNASKYEFDPLAEEYAIVQDDKQHFRDYIESLGLQTPDKKQDLAEHWMDDDVLREGVIKYCNLREAITGTLPEITVVPKKKLILDELEWAGWLKENG